MTLKSRLIAEVQTRQQRLRELRDMTQDRSERSRLDAELDATQLTLSDLQAMDESALRAARIAPQAGAPTSGRTEERIAVPMRTHELHPQLVHVPLTLLPLAAATDLAAAITRSKKLDRMGRRFWLLGCAGGVFAGLAGLAASQEVEVDAPATDDMMYLHGAGNVAILTASTGLALWRLAHRATLGSAAFGLSACTLSLFTAYLGGEMVYRHGVGVGTTEPPPLLSRSAPFTLARDAVRGVGWLARRTSALLAGEGIRAEAFEAPPLVRMARQAGLGNGGQTRH
jgi:uncharacterized membrane protein